MDTLAKYSRLFQLSQETATWGSIGRLLHWDQETHMPPAGAQPRAQQMELLASLLHKHRTSAEFKEALSELIDLESGKLRVSNLSRAQQAALREWRRDFLMATRLPQRWVKTFATTTSEAVEVWRIARAQADFTHFAPTLQRLVDLWREKSELLGYSVHPYDPHLDEYEPDATVANLTPLFTNLAGPLQKLREGLLQRPLPKHQFLKERYSKNKQMEFGHFLLACTGFTLERGRLDFTSHPFCTSLHPRDGRVTTRVSERDPMENFLALLHEGGHCLYETNLPEEHFGSPLCEAASMAIHESQSRLWETIVGQSKPFWRHALPFLKKLFPRQLDGVSLDAFLKSLRVVRQTPIRIQADEVSYCLHVILRFHLERDLISGSLSVKELPEAWRMGMSELLGIIPSNDAEGCLQDIHWACGHMGYFPTYALGNLYAAQFFESFVATHPDWEEQVAHGEFFHLRDWLKENIHRHGRQYRSTELVRKVTKKALSSQPYLNYLHQKYR